jgi:selenocysteine lyase/cysteine desulfurase
MKTLLKMQYPGSEVIQQEKPGSKISVKAFEKLEESVRTALETYSNVHRGTGHFSMVTTALYEHARSIILNYMNLDQKSYWIVFCSPYASGLLKKIILNKDYKEISSQDIGLPLGIRALAIRKGSLPKGVPFQTGGSVAKMVSPDFVLWADIPQKFEAGTPSVINAIAFAAGIIVRQKYGKDCFRPINKTALSSEDILFHDESTDYKGLELLIELEKSLIGKNLVVPTQEGFSSYINFDNAASTPTFFPVWNVVKKAWRESDRVHGEVIHVVRKIVSSFLGASRDKYDIVFTSNATEAINIASRLIQNDFKDEKDWVVLNTLLEHNSNELPWRYISQASLVRLSVDTDGFINPDELEIILKQYNIEGKYGNKRIKLVAVSGASNVLGTFNNMSLISDIAHKYGARILVDGAQLVAHRTVNIEQWNIDYFAFSGHKIYAPFGSGALVVKKDLVSIEKSELLNIHQSGEENFVGIAALGKAIFLLQRIGMPIIEEKERSLTIRLLNGLLRIKGLEVYGIKDTLSPKFFQKGAIVPFTTMPKLAHNRMARELAEKVGIGVRFGCFCTHLLVKHVLHLSPVLQRIQNIILTVIPRISNVVPGLVRVSFGIENEHIEVDKFLVVIEKIMDTSGSRVKSPSAIEVKERMKQFCDERTRIVYGGE